MADSILAASWGIFPLTAYSMFLTKGLMVSTVSLNPWSDTSLLVLISLLLSVMVLLGGRQQADLWGRGEVHTSVLEGVEQPRVRLVSVLLALALRCKVHLISFAVWTVSRCSIICAVGLWLAVYGLSKLETKHVFATTRGESKIHNMNI